MFVGSALWSRVRHFLPLAGGGQHGPPSYSSNSVNFLRAPPAPDSEPPVPGRDIGAEPPEKPGGLICGKFDTSSAFAAGVNAGKSTGSCVFSILGALSGISVFNSEGGFRSPSLLLSSRSWMTRSKAVRRLSCKRRSSLHPAQMRIAHHPQTKRYSAGSSLLSIAPVVPRCPMVLHVIQGTLWWRL